MKKFRARFFDIREGEGLSALLMFLYIFLIIASLMILKPVRNSLFLTRFGVEKLPFVFVLVAVFATCVSFIQSKFHKSKILNYQILATLSASILVFLAFWMLLRGGYQQSWFLFGLYIWVSLFGVIASTQFWLLANHIYNAREAKRLFRLIGIGSISGGICGGYIAKHFVHILKTENMILVSVAFMIVCVFLLFLVWARSSAKKRRESVSTPKSSKEPEITDNPVKLILGSKHLVFLSVLVWAGVCVGNLADYQFNAVASRTITETDDLTAFFGFWMSNLNIISLLVQLFLTGRIIKSYGVGASLFFLPFSLLIGTMTVMVSPVLWSAILIKISDGAFKHSINRGGTELLYLPIPSDIKNKAKMFIDVVIKNLATGLAGVFLILLTTVMHLSVRHVGVINIVLIALWIYLIVNIKREYVNSFRNAILKRTINPEQESQNIEDASVFKSMMKVLEGNNERQITYVLGLLEDVHNQDVVPHLSRLVHHPSNDVKAMVLRMAQRYDESNLTDEATKLVGASNQALRVEAIRYLCKRSDDRIETLKSFLNHNDYGVQNAVLLCAAREWRENASFRKTVDLKALVEDKYRDLLAANTGDDNMRKFLVTTAQVIGDAGDRRLYPYLASMFNTAKYPEVVRSAVKSAGEIRDLEFVPFLIRQLKTKEFRRIARDSLTMYGEGVLDTLAKCLENPAEERRIRLAIPGVISSISSQKSVDILEKYLDKSSLPLRYAAIKALNKLRAKHSNLVFDKDLVEKHVFDEADNYSATAFLLLGRRRYEQRQTADVQQNTHTITGVKARRLLIKTLEERLVSNLERIFRLLGLRYDPKDMYNAYLGVVSKKTNLRANAVEFLDNVLERELKRVIIPIVEYGPEAVSRLDMGKHAVETPHPGDGSLNTLLESNDNWLKVCAIYVIAEMRRTEYAETVLQLQSDPDPVIRETARYCVSKIHEPV